MSPGPKTIGRNHAMAFGAATPRGVMNPGPKAVGPTHSIALGAATPRGVTSPGPKAIGPNHAIALGAATPRGVMSPGPKTIPPNRHMALGTANLHEEMRDYDLVHSCFGAWKVQAHHTYRGASGDRSLGFVGGSISVSSFLDHDSIKISARQKLNFSLICCCIFLFTILLTFL